MPEHPQLATKFLAAYFFFLVLRPQPVEKMFPLRTQAADTGFDAVGKHAQRIAKEQLRNVGFVVGQVVVIGAAQFHSCAPSRHSLPPDHGCNNPAHHSH